ncbi:hypothetical protein [Serratia ureilytica]|uniref:hypothetical protein n=1 Tax=Serratia ureilytica TaxID=300181 RepID=UPI0018E8E33F|nr:hypothetical protein [Serratia ureilytica]MBJ2094092.1 hypothetical protein [Serratia ureilytica]
MDNKLSKPVAYMTAEGVAITHLDFESGSWGMHNAAKSDDMWCPLYSQEYVSAMLSEIGEIERSLISNCVDYEFDLIKMKRRAEAAEQRTTGLERHVKDIEATLIAATDEVADLTKERDAASDAIAALYKAVIGERPEWSNWFACLDDVVAEVAQKLATPIKVGFTVEGYFCSACNERYCGNCAHANGAKVQ